MKADHSRTSALNTTGGVAIYLDSNQHERSYDNISLTQQLV